MDKNFGHYDLKQFMEDLEELNIPLSDQQISQFIKYYELLIEWNSFMNLTAITDFDEILKKHFIDSLSIVKAFDEMKEDIRSKKVRLIDVGTGAGFPGIPLKIAFPNFDITLLDSLHKRIKFLDEVVNQLSLVRISPIHGRAEDYAKPDKLREKYDLCVSRAVANLSTLSEYCLPFVKKEGLFISYKSEKLIEELREAEKAVSILGGKIENQIYFPLPSSDINRNLLIIKKIKNTPSKFPRKAGLPAKEPIRV
ncbi:16S rRNA (guanine(527)-N(7))-methyltransferase RsmG [Kineothrix sp. MB12-C1]|uniref:16S rRNA (guanine(527)-N(7))-methyltransferase RsmG n=1 Tax=Kineothrix sp. MB12-C1 TaxID=3070215 RepID=UPI0027D3051D|nr:16S rRNA (guanine(527)-N(7))-methyltransferase RsmG [Kineothrix sp. MB12-C1]WMC91095.1 16S rRNA (guanine(527)-N(7))-methyltransferase RsmG [Kineothrix sp. MB12-C1]